MLDKLPDYTNLTKSDRELLEETFGNDYEKILDFKAYDDDSLEGIYFIHASINPDDNINWLKKKLFYYLRKHIDISSHEELYMWLNKRFQVTPQVIDQFILNTFKNDRRIEYAYFHECAANFFGLSTIKHLPKKHETYQFIDKMQVIMLIHTLKVAKHVEPIFFKYTTDTFFEYTNYHPFEELTLQDASSIDTLSVSSYDALLLETFGVSDVNDGCLNMTTYKLLNAHMKQSKKADKVKINKFFPHVDDKQSPEYQASTLEFVRTIESAETAVNNHQIEDGHNTGTFVNFLHLRTNEVTFNARQDLETLFETLETSEQMPFMKMKAINNNYYKVHKESLLTIKTETLDKWTDVKVSQFGKQVDTSYVQVKLKYNKDVYCSLLIFDNMCYDVKFTFGNMMRETLSNIVVFLSKVNKIIATVRSLYPNAYVPDIDVDLSATSYNSNTKVVRWLSFNTINSDKHTLNYKNFVKVINSKLYSYFNIIKNPNKNILHLQYKKIDNYLKFENIQVFITNHFVKDRNEMVRKLVAEFVISTEDAERELDKWLASNELEVMKLGDKIFIKPKNDNFVNVKIRLTSSIDLTFNIEGAKNTLIHERILHLMLVLMDMANRHHTSNTNTNTNTKAIDAFIYDTTHDKHETSSPSIDGQFGQFGQFGEFGDLADLDDFDNYEEFGEMFEDDEDLKALELEFMKEVGNAAMEPTNTQVSDKGKGKGTNKAKDDEDDEDSVMKSYFMNMLKSADRDLIDYKVPKGQKLLKRYSTVCQWNDRRQPVVVNQQELDKIKTLQKDIKYVKTGSTKELQEKNFYICPQVWCPKSKTALTYQDFKEKYNESCPYPEIEEKPIMLTNHYWGKGEKGQTREHYPGFLDAKTHPKQLCLPCCFKKEAKEGTKNKQKENTCKTQWSEEPQVEDDTEVFGNEKYIKADIFVPLEVARFGLLPKAFSDILGGQSCGNGVDGKGLMNDKTNCLLRKGISQKSQSFITAVLTLLENPNIPTYTSFTENFATHMSVEKFVSLENGKVMKLFINKDFDIFNGKNFTKFVSWFLDSEQDAYVKLFKLNNIRQDLKDYDGRVFKQEAFKRFKSIIREFLIFNAYIHFVDYVTNPAIEKNYNLLIDFIQSEHEWLNVNYYNIVVIEYEPTTGTTHMICPFNRNAKVAFDTTDPFIFIFKQNNYYEPLCHVKVNHGDINLTTKFVLKTAPNNIKRLIQFYLTNCSNDMPTHSAHDIVTFIRSLGMSIKTYVIDYSFQVCGFLIKSYNMFIPLKERTDIFDLNDANFIYYDDLSNYKITVEEKLVDTVIKEIFNGLYKATKEPFYRVNTIIKSSDGKRTVGFTLGDSDYFIPTNYSDNVTNADVAYVNNLLQDDLDIFIGYEKKDKRIERIEKDTVQKRMLKAFTNEITDYITRDKDALTEFNFIMDSNNPFPSAYRRHKLVELVNAVIKHSDAVSKIHSDYGADLVRLSWQFVEDTMQKSSVNSHNVMLKQLFGLKKKFKKAPTEFMFDQKDVIEGKLAEKLRFIQNPYASLIDRLDRHMKDYVLDMDDENGENGENDVDERNHLLTYVNSNTLYEDVPYKFRKVLPEYKQVHVTGNYTINTLYDIFLKIALTKKVSNITKQTVLNQVVMKQLIIDYRNANIDEFLDNPSFQFNAKAMKIKTHHIDNLITVFESMNYYPSFYELAVLSNIARVNVIVIGRKRKDNAEGIEVFHNKSSRYIILCHSYDRIEHHDTFHLLVKDASKATSKIIFRKHELSRPFVDYIEKSIKL